MGTSGWHNWNKRKAEKTIEYVEAESRGVGADLSGRIRWMKKPDKKKVYTPEAYLGGSDQWSPIEK